LQPGSRMSCSCSRGARSGFGDAGGEVGFDTWHTPRLRTQNLSFFPPLAYTGSARQQPLRILVVRVIGATHQRLSGLFFAADRRPFGRGPVEGGQRPSDDDFAPGSDRRFAAVPVPLLGPAARA